MHRLYPANLNPRASRDMLSMIRDLYSRRPETQELEPWELQMLLWSFDYTDHLLPEYEIAAAVEAARTHIDPDERVA